MSSLEQIDSMSENNRQFLPEIRKLRELGFEDITSIDKEACAVRNTFLECVESDPDEPGDASRANSETELHVLKKGLDNRVNDIERSINDLTIERPINDLNTASAIATAEEKKVRKSGRIRQRQRKRRQKATSV